MAANVFLSRPSQRATGMGELPRSGASMGRSGIGAPFPFPLAPAEVGYLNGHRPFSLGGGNGSKCPIAVIDGATRREGAAVAIKRSVGHFR